MLILQWGIDYKEGTYGEASDLSKVTQLVTCRTKIWTQDRLVLEAMLITMYPLPLPPKPAEVSQLPIF